MKHIDLVGKKINSLSIIERVDAPSHLKQNKESYYRCICSCGIETICTSRSLREGRNTQLNCECDVENTIRKAMGEKYGRLTILSRAEMPEKVKEKGVFRLYVNCICDCGNIVNGQYLSNLKRSSKEKRQISCGCSKGIQDPKKAILGSAKAVWRNSYKDGDISFEKFLELSNKNCYYCNSKPSTITNIYVYSLNRKNKKPRKIISRIVPTTALENGNFIYNGLDRIDSSKKHNLDNVVTCCKICNYMKLDHSIEKFRSHIEKIYDFYIKNHREKVQ